ncbi:MAG: asparagine synthetase B family protein [Phycisphaerales bacterium]
MCGIAGVLRIHELGSKPPHPLEAIPEAWLDVLDDGIKHRGPDGQGRFRDRATRPDGSVVDVAFVHRRLSILDHEGGHQPMVHDGERLRPDLTYQPGEPPKLAHELCPDKPLVAVVFNGCIYNQHELRTELTQQGAWFETDHSDTEVLVHGWRGWYDPQAAWIKQLEGMFGLAIWSRPNADIVIARDTFGEKPLYVAADDRDTIFTFASSATALIACGGVTPLLSMEEHACLEWVRFGYHGRFTPQDSLQQFGPGERGRPRRPYTPAQRPTARHPLRPRSWQKLRRALPSHPSGTAEVHRVDRLLRAAVQARLETDVPLACLLSGGVDSSLISAYASEATNDRLRTLCVRMPDDRFDESPHAEVVARHLGTKHEVVQANAHPAEDLQLLIQSLGLPFGDSSLLPTFWACQAAREHAGVLLSGDGGDELFLGYERYKTAGWLGTGLFWGPLEPIMQHGVLLPPRRDPKSLSDKVARF